MIIASGPGFRGGFSSRHDGDLAFWSQPEEQIERHWKKMTRGIPGTSVLPRFANQIHEDGLLMVTATSPAGLQGKADGLVCVDPGVPIGVFTADCLPVLIGSRKAVAAVHSGWRSASMDIAGQATRKLVEQTGEAASELEAWLGPCIGTSCLEMGDEVPPLFTERDPAAAGFFSHGRKWHLDLRGLVTFQLHRAGIQSQRIHQINDCTKCRPDDYFSYRGQNGRQGSMFSWIVRVENE